jgi:serine/threonine protein kinase
MDTQPSNHPPRDAGTISFAPAAAPGELGRLGQYRVLKELGRGGMGAVYLAEDATLGRKVALKVMLPGFAAQDAARARFLRAARAVAALKHDHVVTVYQAGEEGGVPFLAMELLAGKSLDEWLRPDRRATPAQVVTIGRQIAEGLAAAHAAGLVHRDVKPANVWLEAPKGRVKLLDFGLARGAGGGDPGLTGAGDILGTPAYMAPEQARGQPVDHRCDLFALGCVLYRMATGRVPFQGDSAYGVIVAVVSEEPAKPRAVNPDVPPELEALILALLEKDPANRPASAAAVVAELKRLAARLNSTEKLDLPPPDPAAGDATAAWSDGADTAARPRRTRLVVAGLAAVAVFGLVLVLVVGRRDGRPQEPEEPAPKTPEVVAAPTRKEPPPLGNPEPAPETSLVGTWDGQFVGSAKGALVFTADGKVTGEWGFKGVWAQAGRKVGMTGAGGKGGPGVKIKGELDADGQTLRLFNPKGGVDTYRRR